MSANVQRKTPHTHTHTQTMQTCMCAVERMNTKKARLCEGEREREINAKIGAALDVKGAIK